MLVPNEALGALELEAFLRVGGERAATRALGTGAVWLWAMGGRWGSARLAVGRDPLDAAIGGDALLKAALHQLGVVALLLHLRPSQGLVSVSGSGFRVRFRGGARVG